MFESNNSHASNLLTCKQEDNNIINTSHQYFGMVMHIHFNRVNFQDQITDCHLHLPNELQRLLDSLHELLFSIDDIKIFNVYNTLRPSLQLLLLDKQHCMHKNCCFKLCKDACHLKYNKLQKHQSLKLHSLTIQRVDYLSHERINSLAQWHEWQPSIYGDHR